MCDITYLIGLRILDAYKIPVVQSFTFGFFVACILFARFSRDGMLHLPGRQVMQNILELLLLSIAAGVGKLMLVM